MKILHPAAGLFILLFSFVLIKPAYPEYNLATGEEELILISQDKEVKMGDSLSRQVEEKMKLDENYTNQDKVDVIGQKLANVSDRKDLIFHFKVINDDKDNAFSLPGGYVYIFSGLLEKLESDDEIAAVLSHEMGHICAKHSLKRLQNSFGYTALRFLVIRGAEDAYSARKASEAIDQLMLSYSRKDELESDRLAVKYLEKAGYNPEAMVSVIDKLIKSQNEGPITAKRYWYTHPYLAARKGAVRKEVTGQMSFDDYINVTEDEGYVLSK